MFLVNIRKSVFLIMYIYNIQYIYIYYLHGHKELLMTKMFLYVTLYSPRELASLLLSNAIPMG